MTYIQLHSHIRFKAVVGRMKLEIAIISVAGRHTVGNRNKPALLVDDTYALWLGNETIEELSFEQCELCGFNLGQFEEKVVAGHLA